MEGFKIGCMESNRAAENNKTGMFSSCFLHWKMLLGRFISDGQLAKDAEEDGKGISLKEIMQTALKQRDANS